ncbi:MAG: triose-phosphate isomerase [Spirochaetales bacterium]|nr:triose-phosphate isomerase [Spirochaetales bacterium]
MRKKIAAGNWKMFKTPQETREFLRAIKSLPPPSCEVVIAPTYLCLDAAVSESAGTFVQIAAQNCYSQNQGAFTGEISPAQLRASGVTHVILGHSERRHVFKESDQDINKKCNLALKEGLLPIFCVGEQLAERKTGQLRSVLEKQILYGLEGIDLPAADKFVIAYEPVWAIGTGETATPEDAQEAHAFLRELMGRTAGADFAQKVRILYGGSVKPGNTAALTAKPDVDGVLVGGASLDVDSFGQIIAAVRIQG